MKKWVMIPLVLIVSIVTGVGYYYYNYIYKAPEATKSRELMETNSAFEYLIGDAQIRVDENDYDIKVLINPICGGADYGLTQGKLKESEVALDIARYVESLNTDESIGIFLTRDTDTNPISDQRQRFIEVVQPDIVVEIALSGGNDESAIGVSAWYDDEYYDYHLTNSHLADIMEKSVVTETEGVAEGIFPLGADMADFIKGCRIPSVSIRCGYISNPKEAQALGSEAYKANIAEGILKGIAQAKDELQE